MKKSLEKGFITPLPVFIIATYDEIGANIGGAWAAGKKFE